MQSLGLISLSINQSASFLDTFLRADTIRNFSGHRLSIFTQFDSFHFVLCDLICG